MSFKKTFRTVVTCCYPMYLFAALFLIPFAGIAYLIESNIIMVVLREMSYKRFKNYREEFRK